MSELSFSQSLKLLLVSRGQRDREAGWGVGCGALTEAGLQAALGLTRAQGGERGQNPDTVHPRVLQPHHPWSPCLRRPWEPWAPGQLSGSCLRQPVPTRSGHLCPGI